MIESGEEKVLDEIVNISYDILTRKLAHGGITAKNEAAFQLEFGHILKTIGQLYEFNVGDKFYLEFESRTILSEISVKSGSLRARIDIYIVYNGIKTAIELKFLQKKNHREPNNRFDVFADIKNLEKYKSHGIDLCYFILATDHSHYASNEEALSADTKDFNFRHGSKYIGGTQLSYNTAKRYKGTLTLDQDYSFEWKKVKDLHFLKVKV